MFLLVSGGRLRLFMKIATLQKCLFLEVNWGRFSCTGSHRFNTWNIFVSNRPSPTNFSPPDQEFGSDAVWPFQTFLSRVELSNATVFRLPVFTIQLRRPKKKAKNHVTLIEKFAGKCCGEVWGQAVNTSNFGSKGPEFKPRPSRCFLRQGTLLPFFHFKTTFDNKWMEIWSSPLRLKTKN